MFFGNPNPKNLHTMSDAGIAILKSFEAFRAKPYYDGAGRLTVGYGTTAGVSPGMVVTEEQAVEMLHRDVITFERVINKLVTVELNQNQFDALVCFVYNVGGTNFRESTLLKRLNLEDWELIGKEWKRWNKIHEAVTGKLVESKGLTNRRAAELKLFETPMHDHEIN